MEENKKEKTIKVLKIIAFEIFKIILMIFAFWGGFFAGILEDKRK